MLIYSPLIITLLSILTPKPLQLKQQFVNIITVQRVVHVYKRSQKHLVPLVNAKHITT